MPFSASVKRARKASPFEHGFSVELSTFGPAKYAIGKISGPSNNDDEGIKEFAGNVMACRYAPDMLSILQELVNAKGEDAESARYRAVALLASIQEETARVETEIKAHAQMRTAS